MHLSQPERPIFQWQRFQIYTPNKQKFFLTWSYIKSKNKFFLFSVWSVDVSNFFFLYGVTTIMWKVRSCSLPFQAPWCSSYSTSQTGPNPVNKYFQYCCFLYILPKRNDITAAVPGTPEMMGKYKQCSICSSFAIAIKKRAKQAFDWWLVSTVRWQQLCKWTISGKSWWQLFDKMQQFW